MKKPIIRKNERIGILVRDLGAHESKRVPVMCREFCPTSGMGLHESATPCVLGRWTVSDASSGYALRTGLTLAQGRRYVRGTHTGRTLRRYLSGMLTGQFSAAGLRAMKALHKYLARVQF